MGEAGALDVFFSYSHQDEEFLAELEKHLALLRREGWLSTWHSQKIQAGEDWERVTHRRLESADVILLLVSADFLAADFCWEVGVERALARHEQGKARIVPVILRDCDWKTAPFASLQALPKGGRPIAAWPQRDEAFANVARSLRTLIESWNPDVQHPVPAVTKDLTHALEAARERKAELLVRGEDPAAIEEEILDLRRRIREGGLKAGVDLLDGRIKLHRLIGKGGFATVWKAIYRTAGRDPEVVAVKVLHPQYNYDATRLERFVRGARLQMILSRDSRD